MQPKKLLGYGWLLLIFTLLNQLFLNNVLAEGLTSFNKEFFKQVEPIKLKEPLAIALGAINREEVFVYNYEDAVKLAGHSCLAVSGAYRLTQIALKKLYGAEIPVRGEIKVTVRGGVADKVNGPISQVITFITGAAGDNGFHGLASGKYGRYNLLQFDKNSQPPEGALCSVIFERMGNGKSVEVTYTNNMLPGNPLMAKLMPLAVSGSASDAELKEFGNLWHERVKMVLLDDVEGMFVTKEK